MSQQDHLALPAGAGGLSIVDRIKNSLSPGPATSKDSTPEKDQKVVFKLSLNTPRIDFANML